MFVEVIIAVVVLLHRISPHHSHSCQVDCIVSPYSSAFCSTLPRICNLLILLSISVVSSLQKSITLQNNNKKIMLLHFNKQTR